jgi:hypothetical protein
MCCEHAAHAIAVRSFAHRRNRPRTRRPPPVFVVVEDQYDSAMRFNRTLDTRNPYTRSGQGWFATDDQLQHEFKASSLVIYLIAVALIVAVAVGSLQ